MAVQASTMMSDPSITTPKPAGSGFPRKVILLMLLQIASVFGLFLLFKRNPEAPLLGLNLLATMLLGMVAGLGTRFLLRKRNWFIRFITGTASLIIGLFIFGLLTKWRVCFWPLIFWRKTIDSVGLAELAIGIRQFLLIVDVSPRSTATSLITPAPINRAAAGMAADAR